MRVGSPVNSESPRGNLENCKLQSLCVPRCWGAPVSVSFAPFKYPSAEIEAAAVPGGLPSTGHSPSREERGSRVFFLPAVLLFTLSGASVYFLHKMGCGDVAPGKNG